MALELEYKYAATPEILEKIAADFSGFRKIEMRTTYYDTESGCLSAMRATLRLRQENDTSICTLKLPRPDGHREEWECEAATIEAGLAKISQAAGLPDGPLKEVCGARFTRLAAMVPTAEGMAELALDRGVLQGGGRELPLCELELEYKSGDPAAVQALAQALAARYGLQAEPRSKFARASALAKGESHG